jgi:Matrixin
LPIWKSVNAEFNFSRNKNAGLFWNLFYTEIYLIYFKYIKVLLPEFLTKMISKNGLILCTMHEQFYSNEKINIVGFSRGFPFSHVILSKASEAHVLAHEIGHTCGLWHKKEEYNLMYPLTPKKPVKISRQQYQAILRARYIYLN